MPYSELDPEFGALLEHPEIVHPQLWMSSCPLIFYDRVEMCRPDRVLRQFGRIQHIPPHPTDHDIEIKLHSYDRRGAVGRDWAIFHNIYVDRWHARLDSFTDYPFIEISGPQTDPGYYDWYDRHTRRLISPVDNLDDIGFQIGDPILLDLVGNQLISMSLAARAVSRDDDRIYDRYQDNATRMYAAGTQLLRRDTDSSNIPPIPPIPSQTQGRRTRRRSGTAELEDDVRQTREGNYYASTSRVPPAEDVVGPLASHTPFYGHVPMHGGMDDLSGTHGFMDMFGASTSQVPTYRDLFGPSTTDYVPDIPWSNSLATPYPPAIDTQFTSWGPHLELNLGYSNPQERARPQYNVSPVPYPADDTEFVDDVPVERDVRRDGRQRRTRRPPACGTGGHRQ
ncbi:PREDICTED: uncharacterized protein LOC105969764 isoform X2 [Erythranthe guttata]|nr:PREDICTED: uncharacterized protein LOC105969764 isoform X2 [Erythranthe guttata]XP_012849999.1 PREDICTED: uncharacterized protein LOC105969764 isoform X2 [Erythranthe guttata]|eukprot:XP_012849998.1 PREDICTED: uncharacterized protein LOC105969764 isoform X2 [Erythranthe guttata]